MPEASGDNPANATFIETRTLEVPAHSLESPAKAAKSPRGKKARESDAVARLGKRSGQTSPMLPHSRSEGCPVYIQLMTHC